MLNALSKPTSESIAYDAVILSRGFPFSLSDPARGVDQKASLGKVWPGFGPRLRQQNPRSSLTSIGAKRGAAPLTTATSIRYIEENFDISALPDDAIEEITQGISTRLRLNSVVNTGIPGFIPRSR